MPTVLALDVSLTSTGWAVSESGSLATHGVFKPFKSKADNPPHLARMQHILKELSQLVSIWKPFLVVMEGLSMHSKSSSLDQICGMAYLIRYWLWNNKIPFVLVTPTQLKKFVTGKGTSDKELMIKYILSKFGHDVDTSHEADAIGLCMIGRALTDSYSPQNEQQRSVVAALRPMYAANS